MNITLDGLPKDSSNTRKAKLFLMAYFVYNHSEGVSHTKLFNFVKKSWGHIPKTIEAMIRDIVSMELVTQTGMSYSVADTNMREWGESNGFVEVPKPVICTDCGQNYNSNHSRCPKCKSLSREKAQNTVRTPPVPTPPYIHTHVPSDLLDIEEVQIEPAPMDEPLGETANQPPYTYTHTKKGSRPGVGADAEQRVADLLSTFGRARRGRGSYGEPDVFWNTENYRYGCEVKSVAHGSKCNAFKLSRKSWLRFVDYCDLHDLKPILVVEERINGSKYGHVYHLILREMVDLKLNASEADRVSFSVYELGTLHYQAIRPDYPFMLRAVL